MKSLPYNTSRWLRFRVWFWMLRYAVHVWSRSRTVEDARLYWAFCWEMAETGWWVQFSWEKDCTSSKDPVRAALDESPIDVAEEEMSCWTDDEGGTAT